MVADADDSYSDYITLGLGALRLALAGGTAAFLKQFAGGEVAAARMQQAKAVIDAYSAASKAYAKAGGWPSGIVPAASSFAYGMANVAAIEKTIADVGMKYAATGMDEIVDRPTVIMAGEGGRAESVQITPLEGPNIDGPQGGGGQNITLNISAPLVDDTVVDTIIPAIQEALRRGEQLDAN